jgi:hypothetical protein
MVKKFIIFALIGILGFFLAACSSAEDEQYGEQTFDSPEEQAEYEAEMEEWDNVYVGSVNFNDGINANCNSYEAAFRCTWTKEDNYTYENAMIDFAPDKAFPQTVRKDIGKSSFTYPDEEEDYIKYKKVLLEDNTITYCAYRNFYPERFDCVVIYPSGDDVEVVKKEENHNW